MENSFKKEKFSLYKYDLTKKFCNIEYLIINVQYYSFCSMIENLYSPQGFFKNLLS